MSNEQPPRDDDQDVAEYRRTDPAGEPTHPAGQQAAVEGMLAARGIHDLVDPDKVGPKLAARNRRKLAENITNDTALGRLQLDMLAAFEEFDRARRAEIIAAGGTSEDADDDGWGDTLSRSNLVSVARAHRNANQPHRTKEGDLDRLLDDLADEFELADVRIIRGVAAALADAMPRIAHKAREQQGMSPDEIARKTGYTASRIAQFIRQEKERRAAPGTLRRYTWRVDVEGADGEWTDREAGEDESTPADLAQLAERLLDETGARDQRARIVMWEGDEGDDAAAVHRAERDPQ
jgi:transcriptional regulator with XRE-family HTH domain